MVGHTRDDSSDGFNPVPVIAFTDQQGHRVEFSPEMRGPAVYMLLSAAAFAGAGVLIALKN
ncbi:hypothetical protein [Streptomyces sp. NPDC058755]|uniref:hypothetical protein n=1 Tax=Streptomyces sp. NPDC058755 TaxID=3346624 RepID=UPI00369363CC